jgi:molybdate transport system regulatory protein
MDRVPAKSGTTTVPEAVISGTVVEKAGELATVRTPAGDVTARVPSTAEDVEIAVRADAVVLMRPDSSGHTSLRNQMPGVVSELVIDETLATVTVEIGNGVTIKSVVTEESVDRLDLAEGEDVVAAFKTTAARAIAANP